MAVRSHASIPELRGITVSVIGAARSGIAAAKVLQNLGAHVVLSDSASAAQLLPERVAAIEKLGVTFVPEASAPDAIPASTRLVVTSPGVAKSAAVLQYAVSKSIPIWSEIEIAYRISPAPIVAVTGTNGKTTTTLLIEAALLRGGIQTVAAGNISADEIKKTLVEAAYEALSAGTRNQVLTAEISSFQLEWTDLFAPWIGLLLNVSADHLNRHASYEEYAAAKARLFRCQAGTDWAILNYDDCTTRTIVATPATRLWVSAANRPELDGPAAWVEQGSITVALDPAKPVRIVAVSDLPASLPGRHSVFNAAAASAAALIAGVAPDCIAAALREFPGVPHRMELVEEAAGIRYLNNSMCTNPAAFISSLEAVGRPAVVIAGGADKAADFASLAVPLRRFARAVVLIGAAADKMDTAFRSGGFLDTHRAGNMDEAVSLASSLAAVGDTVILSPACASFDMYRDFEDRGAAFRSAVKALLRDAGRKETR